VQGRPETSWQPTYNAGANPVPVRLRKAELARPRHPGPAGATFEILARGALPWSERQAKPAHQETETEAGDTPPATRMPG
jgi:hypothetical protein